MTPTPAGSSDRNRDAVPSLLSKYIGKLLLLRGARDVTCRVFRPSGAGTYPAMLDRGAVSEQFFLNSKDVDQFVRTGIEVNLSTEVRTALRNLEKRTLRKTAARR